MAYNGLHKIECDSEKIQLSLDKYFLPNKFNRLQLIELYHRLLLLGVNCDNLVPEMSRPQSGAQRANPSQKYKKNGKKNIESASLLDSLRTEWALFWASFIPSNAENQEKSVQDFLSDLDVDKIKLLKKSLSEERRRLYMRLEEIKNKIEDQNSKFESLGLVQGDTHETSSLISELNSEGQVVSEELARVDHRLKLARAHERILATSVV